MTDPIDVTDDEEDANDAIPDEDGVGVAPELEPGEEGEEDV